MAGNNDHHSSALAAIANLHRSFNFGKHEPSPVAFRRALLDKLPVGGNWSGSEVLRYGDLAAATYEAFDSDEWSPHYGTCRHGVRRMLPALGLAGHGYVATAFIYATVDILPQWVEPILNADKWDDGAHWIGYVAVAGDAEASRVGFRDIAVVWRGTNAQVEWVLNVRSILVPFDVDGKKKEKVARGFYGLYTSKNPASVHGVLSAREQVAAELKRLVDHFQGKRGEKVRVTVTGHSLGGALALLAARDAASARLGLGVPVRAITFCAPRVGNRAFRDGLVSRGGVAVLRVVVRNDVVPWLPCVPAANLLALPFSLLLGRALAALTRGWAPCWVYVHAGDELVLDVATSEHLKQAYDMRGVHSLDVCLHLLDRGARRDVALVNKYSGMLRPELRIPAWWFQPHNKGLTRDESGRWFLPEREHDDLPVPNEKLPLSELHVLGSE